MKAQRAMAAALVMGWLGMANPAARGQAVNDAPKVDVAKEKASFIAGKPELARVYLELERLVMERAGTMPVETLRRVNVGMDNAANGFFTGNYSRAIKGVNAQIGAIRPGCEQTDAIAIRVDPAVVRRGARIRATAGLMYPTQDSSNEPLDVTIGPRSVQMVHTGPLREAIAGQFVHANLKAGIAARDYEFPLPSEDDRWAVAATGPEKAGTACSTPWRPNVYSSAQSLDELRESLLNRLELLKRAHEDLSPAVAATRWRTRAISDRLSLDNTFLFTADPLQYSEYVRMEVETLEKGQDPFRNSWSDAWLVLQVGDVEVPARLLAAPPREPGTLRPLLIAVHGAGGDENLWMDGYGGGVLKDIAIEKHMVVVSPRIVPGLFTPAMFDGIVEAVAKWQDVDRSRVYVIGHSMGGGVVTAWAKWRSEKIAAACSIAGIGSFTGAKKMAPMLAYAAELDGLIRPEGIRRSAEAGKVAGLDVEFREVANYGHVLVVGKVTREAVEWMMERKLKGEVGSGKAEGKGEK